MRKLNLKNKRGDLHSVIIMIVIVCMLAMLCLIFARAFVPLMSSLRDTGKFSNRTNSNFQMVEDKTIPLLDFLCFFTLIAMMIGIIISSIYIDTHPAILVVFIIGLIFAVFLSGMLANAYTAMRTNDALSEIGDQFVMTNLILGEHFPMIILFVVVIVVVVLYGKSRGVAGA